MTVTPSNRERRGENIKSCSSFSLKMSAFLYSPSRNLRVIPTSDHWQTQDLLAVLSEDNEAVCPDSIYILHNGRPPCKQNTLTISANDVVRVIYRLPGGKGGFGSMLRAIGAQIEKTTSREACRDLSGRRMRDVNDEKKITEWVAKQADRERELARQKQERLEKRRAGPKHNFDDTTYTKQIQDNLEKIDDALKQGLKASTSASGLEIGVKRTSTIVSGDAPKKPRIWGMDIDEEELDDSDDETQMITNQLSSSTSTSTMSTPATSGTTSASDVSDQKNSRDERSADQPSTSAAPISDSATNIDATRDKSAIYCNTAVSTDSSSEGNSSDATEMSLTKECGVVTKTEENKPENKISENKLDVENLRKEEDMKPFNIDDYNTAEELESLGLEPLKEDLKTLGLKCGGTLQERAQRLFSTKGKALKDLDPSLFAKPSKGKNKQKKK